MAVVVEAAGAAAAGMVEAAEAGMGEAAVAEAEAMAVLDQEAEVEDTRAAGVDLAEPTATAQ